MNRLGTSASTSKLRNAMIILGIILLICGFVFKVPILWTIGIVLLVIGAVLWILGSMGHAVGGRRHYY
jgi:fatty-acid desaturase